MSNTVAKDSRLLRLGNRMYAFWRTAGNFLQYAYATTPGADSKGSCNSLAGATLQDQAPCLSWSAPNHFGQDVDGFSATAFETGAEQTIVVAYRNSVHVRANVVRPASASDGSLVNVTEPVVIDAPFLVDPEVSVMHVEPGTFGGANKIVGLFLGGPPPNNYRWHSLRTPAGSWINEGEVIHRKRTLTPLGGWIYNINPMPAQSAMRASVIPWPDANNSYGASVPGACAVFPTAALKPLIYCYDQANNFWRELNDSTCLKQEYGGSGCWSSSAVLTGPAALAYHVPRKADGQPIEDGRGALWMFLPSDADLDGRFYLSQVLNAGTPPWAVANSDIFQPLNGFNAYGLHGALALYEDWDLAALRGMRLGNDDAGDTVRFLPFVDGTFTAALKDGNDFAVMERRLCRGLRFTVGDLDLHCGRPFPGGL